MYSPLFYEMLAQNRADEVAAAAEARRAAAENAVYLPVGGRPLVRSAKVLVSSACHAVQHVLLAIREGVRAPLLRPPSTSSQ
jgi:hypothetical protein